MIANKKILNTEPVNTHPGDLGDAPGMAFTSTISNAILKNQKDRPRFPFKCRRKSLVRILSHIR